MLDSWNDGATKSAIVDFVGRVTAEGGPDFVAPEAAGVADALGMFVVTAGAEVDAIARELEASHDDYSAILVKTLGDRLVEAGAEWLHRQARRDWGFGRDERLSLEELLKERYRGIRPAPGYPACPDHSEKGVIFRLLDAGRRTGVRLTETFAMFPGSSISGFYFSHPSARYFAVGPIGRDQAEDYAARKGLPLPEVERFLVSSLPGEIRAAAPAPA